MEEYDRLSDLPDSLIFDIFGYLATSYAVRTTIFSKRWKNLWTTIPFLNFNNVKMMMESDKFRNFVNKVLKSWRGNRIFGFGATFGIDDHSLILNCGDDIDSWLRFAVENKVEELHLIFPLPFYLPEKKLYVVAQDLYSCSSLKKLELGSCDLQIHGQVQWDQLKSLKMSGGGLSQNGIDKVLCGSPRLESLFLLWIQQNDNET